MKARHSHHIEPHLLHQGGRRSASLGQRTGFSLIEVVVAFGIITVIFAGVFAALVQGMNIIEHSRDLTRVSQILQTEMEQLRTRSWVDLNALPEKAEFRVQGVFDQTSSYRYTCVRTITTRKEDQKQLMVAASWTDSRGIRHTRSYTTFFTREGINDYYFRTF